MDIENRLGRLEAAVEQLKSEMSELKEIDQRVVASMSVHGIDMALLKDQVKRLNDSAAWIQRIVLGAVIVAVAGLVIGAESKLPEFASPSSQKIAPIEGPQSPNDRKDLLKAQP